jgi:CheY-like chemotaxis protein
MEGEAREDNDRGGKILLADPSADYRELVSLYLRILNYPAPTHAEDGEQALSKALSDQPDLIIMEVRLPKLNGFEIVARLRGDPRTRGARILAATAMAMPGDRDKCLAGGFDAYLAKPFTMKQLQQILRSRSPTEYPPPGY